jgi:CHAD domain-containing protein
LAARKLDRLHADVLAAAQGFAGQTPGQRHALRIRVKRLRYALDYLGGLFGGHKKFAARFASLQDELGALNDAATAQRFLGQLNADGRMDALAAQLAGRLEARLQGRLGETVDRLQGFSRLAPPWR